MTLVQRLRSYADAHGINPRGFWPDATMREAADRLERYEAALREIAAMEPETRGEVAADEKVRIAREALGEGENEQP